jgi:tight adherence protein C
MSLELMFVIGLWVLALAMTGVSILQEVRARQLRERVARLVRTRVTMEEEEMPTEMPEDEELRQSIAQRLFRAFLLPWIQRLSRLLPQSGATLKGTEELLAMAGYPFGLTASDFMGLRLLCTFVGAALGVLLPILLSLWRPDFFVPSLPLFAAAILAFAGFLGPVFWLRRAAMRRRHLIRRQLPDMLDLITLSIEAGLAFDGAVYEAARRFKGPLCRRTDESDARSHLRQAPRPSPSGYGGAVETGGHLFAGFCRPSSRNLGFASSKRLESLGRRVTQEAVAHD